MSKLELCPLDGDNMLIDVGGTLTHSKGRNLSCPLEGIYTTEATWNNRPIEAALTAQLAEKEKRIKVLEDLLVFLDSDMWAVDDANKEVKMWREKIAALKGGN